MTAFNKTNDLPGTITTVEQVYLWAGLILKTVNPTAIIQADVGQNGEKRIQGGNFDDINSKPQYWVSATLEMNSGWETSALKHFLNVKEISNTPIPDAFKP